VQTKPIRLF